MLWQTKLIYLIDPKYYFILYYRALLCFRLDFTVWGCPRISKPSGGWVEQRGDRADMGCSDSSDTYRLSCNGTHWLGPKPNCSSPGNYYFFSFLSILAFLL